MMLMIVVVPLLGITLRMFGLFPWPIGIAVFALGGGGLLRIAYALMFEAKEASDKPREIAGATRKAELPPSQFAPVNSELAPGRWLDTNDLTPLSVTDHTTKLLEKERDDHIR